MTFLKLQRKYVLTSDLHVFQLFFFRLQKLENKSQWFFSCCDLSVLLTLFLLSSSIPCTLVHKSHAIVASCLVSLALSSEGWWQVIADSTAISSLSLEVWSNTIMSDHSCGRYSSASWTFSAFKSSCNKVKLRMMQIQPQE